MSTKLEEMVRIARAATPGPWRTTSHGAIKAKDREIARMGGGGIVCIPDEQHITTFNPRTAEALVKVAMAAAVVYGKAPTHSVNMEDWIALGDALTAAMASEDGQSPAEGLSEAKPSEEDNSNGGRRPDGAGRRERQGGNMTTERTNQYPGVCEHCGKRVEEGEGILFRAGKRKGRWAVKHKDVERCHDFTYSDYCDTVHPFSDENFSQGFGP